MSRYNCSLNAGVGNRLPRQFLQYFLKMSSARVPLLPTLFANPNDWETRLQPLLVQIKTYNIQSTYSIVEEISRTLRGQAEPIRKTEALLVLSRCLLQPNYPLLLFVQLHILPALLPAIEFAAENRELSQLMGYFERSGYSSATQHIHNISYNFIVLSLKVLSACAVIKPYRVYEGREYEEPSLFRRTTQKHMRENIEDLLSPKEDCSPQRQKYLQSLDQWPEYELSLIFLFTELLDGFFTSFSPIPDKPTFNLLFEALHYGETLISSEIIARLVEIMAIHQNFTIRIQALRLLDKMILWGDVEALLVLNFTDHLEQIVKAVCEIKGEISLQEGRFICPDIPQQLQQKQQFYQLFLTSLQNWAITYPSQEYLVYKGGEDVASQPSPVEKFYRLLRDRKKVIFPKNLGITKYEKESKTYFHQKYLRNQLILKDIYQQHLPSQEMSIYFPRGLSQLKDYYQKHKETLIVMLAEKENIYDSMEKLQDFREHFEGMVECMSVEEKQGDELDQTIQNGLELIEIIDLLQHPFQQLIARQLDQKQFREKATAICVRFFTHSEETTVHFYSERVLQKRQNLVGLLRRQKSSPLEKELKDITSSAIVKQFRQKYRHKQERQSSSRNSESSELNLQIYTKTKFTKESREQMDKSNDSSFKNRSVTKGAIVQPSKRQSHNQSQERHNVIIRQNSLNVGFENKKLTVTSKQHMQTPKFKPGQRKEGMRSPLEEPKKEVEVTSQTKTSRQILKDQTYPQRRVVKKQVEALVPLSENSQYFTFMPSEVYKCSYTHPRILIFRSPFLSIERVVHRASERSARMKVDIIFFAHQPLRGVEYTIQEQQCIKIESVGSKLPSVINLNSILVLQFIGEMRKIPLRLPTFALFINHTLVFQYILPFTINFFLTPQEDNIQPLLKEDSRTLTTTRLILSNHLFPEKNLLNLRIYLPGSLQVSPSPLLQLFIWSVSFCKKVSFQIFFQYHAQSGTLIIRGRLVPEKQEFESLLRYIISFFAHLYAEREA